VRGLRGAGLVGARFGRRELCRCEAGGVVGEGSGRREGVVDGGRYPR
jgi:hypothetical protein